MESRRSPFPNTKSLISPTLVTKTDLLVILQENSKMTTYKENIAEARRLILDKEYLNACELFADALEEMLVAYRYKII